MEENGLMQAPAFVLLGNKADTHLTDWLSHRVPDFPGLNPVSIPTAMRMIYIYIFHCLTAPVFGRQRTFVLKLVASTISNGTFVECTANTNLVGFIINLLLTSECTVCSSRYFGYSQWSSCTTVHIKTVVYSQACSDFCLCIFRKCVEIRTGNMLQSTYKRNCGSMFALYGICPTAYFSKQCRYFLKRLLD